MKLGLDSPVLTLEAGQLLSLDDALGTRIHAREGSLWITEEGEAQDFIVGAGESFVVRRAGRTLIQAMAASRVALRDEDPRGVAGELLGEERLLEARFRAQRLLGA
jgi:hypothetical protein